MMAAQGFAPNAIKTLRFKSRGGPMNFEIPATSAEKS